MTLKINLKDDYVEILKNLLIENFNVKLDESPTDFEHIFILFRNILRKKGIIKLKNQAVFLDGRYIEDIEKIQNIQNFFDDTEDKMREEYNNDSKAVVIRLIEKNYNIFLKISEQDKKWLFNTVTLNFPAKILNVYIDESGYKGKSSKLPTNCDKKLSVFVGVPVPVNKENMMSSLFQPLFNKFKAGIPANMKLHITDALASENQAIKNLAMEVKKGYLEIFKEYEEKFIFGAKRASIEKQNFASKQALLKNLRNTMNPNLDIKVPYPRETLEGYAFLDLFGKIEAFTQDYEFDRANLFLDKIDDAKKKEYEAQIEHFRNLNDQTYHKVTAWDKMNKKTVTQEGSISFSVKGIHLENRVANIQIVGKDNPLILLADILANEIHRYMISIPENAKLHAENSYSDFELEKFIYGYYDNWISDIM